jgi:predicted porin
MNAPRKGQRYVRPLLGLGLAAASWGAVAEPMTISGRVDQGVIRTNPGGWEVAHGSANRLIFRGDDDLGGATKAYYYLQHRFYADTGTSRSASQFWYYSYVGLTGKFGDIKLGNQKAPIDDATGSDYEVWDGDTVASSFSRLAGNQKIWTNGVNYTTPGVAGFRVHAGAAASEHVTKTRGQGASLLYDNGGLSAALSVQRSPADVETHAIGGRYVHPQFRVMGTWAKSKRVGGNKEQTDWQVSGGYQVTPAGEARLLYNDSDLAGIGTRVVGAGYFHFLSKRTALYGAASNTKTDGQASIDAYQAGVRHSF